MDNNESFEQEVQAEIESQKKEIENNNDVEENLSLDWLLESLDSLDTLLEDLDQE
ncbi:hypothetical protein [Sulfurimonas sp. HSL3-2]|uniref:hypothetical protein n=1 Tax=Hydrocurvibacter mobilis TaxID=3131936 RepID=UPI0031F81C1D